jgi:hypothetical protein
LTAASAFATAASSEARLTSTVLQVLARDLQRRARLGGLGQRLRGGGAGGVAFARRQRAVGRQLLDPAQIGLGALGLGAGVCHRGLVLGDGGGARCPGSG